MGGNNNRPWPPEDVAELKRLWESRVLSARQIANDNFAGRYSRNAIISQVHRSGFVGGTADVSKAGRQARKAARGKPRRRDDEPKSADAAPPPSRPTRSVAAPQTEEPFVEIRDDDIPRSQLRTLLDLENHHCRWPIGDPRDESFRFCAGDRVLGQPYCYRHTRRAHEAVVANGRPQSARGRQIDASPSTGGGGIVTAAPGSNMEDVDA